jgi:5'-AMP-activated protein kinase, catalytic alpha subunit
MGIDPVPIDHKIMEQLEGYKINSEYARKCLEANKHNHITATYFLLLKKHLKNGGESIADVRSPKYNASVFMKRQAHISDLTNPVNFSAAKQNDKTATKD